MMDLPAEIVNRVLNAALSAKVHKYTRFCLAYNLGYGLNAG